MKHLIIILLLLSVTNCKKHQDNILINNKKASLAKDKLEKPIRIIRIGKATIK